MLTSAQLQSYLQHIRVYEEDLLPSLETLTIIHRQHNRWIPFANVTVARAPTQLMQLNFPKGTPDTSTEGIMEKVIERGW